MKKKWLLSFITVLYTFENKISEITMWVISQNELSKSIKSVTEYVNILGSDSKVAEQEEEYSESSHQ